jgi:hypothetical protein
VFGWKSVHQHDGTLIGKKQDKARRWRTARVPHFSTDPLNAYAVDERMKQLGRSEQYAKKLCRIAKAKKFPQDGEEVSRSTKRFGASSCRINRALYVGQHDFPDEYLVFGFT